MLNRIKERLSSPWVSVICFLIAVITKAGLQEIFLNIGPDKFAQILISRNFLHGHGLSIGQVSVNNLGHTIYAWSNGWPPGYSLLVSPFLSVLDNYMLAGFLVDCITILLFFVYCRQILLLIRFPVWLINLFLLVQGLFINNYIESSTPTDFLSLALLLASLYYLLRITEQPVFPGKTVFLLSFFLAAACFTRYQNISVALLMPVVLSVTGFFQQKKSWVQSGLIVLISIILLCTGFFVWQRFQTGDAFYTVPVRKGFFPENLLLIHPFLIDSVVNLRFYTVQLSQLFHIDYRFCEQLIRWAGMLWLVAFLTAGSTYLFRIKGKVSNTQSGFFLFGFLISLAIAGLLMFLSLTHDKNIGAPMFVWTYVSVGRYFAFPCFFFQVCMWWYLFVHKQGNAFFKGLRGLFILLCLIETSHGIYLLAKKFSKPVTPLEDIVLRQEEVAITIQFIQELQSKDPGRKIITTGFTKKYGFIAGWYGGAGLFTPLALNQELPRSNVPAVLLVVVNKKELFLLDRFLRQPGVQLFREIKDFRLYTYYVEPPSPDSR
jgi:hypothetical protein